MLARLLFADAPSEVMLILTVPPLIRSLPSVRQRCDGPRKIPRLVCHCSVHVARPGAWSYFVAMQTGTPPKMAASIARLIPGFTEPASWLAVIERWSRAQRGWHWSSGAFARARPCSGAADARGGGAHHGLVVINLLYLPR